MSNFYQAHQQDSRQAYPTYKSQSLSIQSLLRQKSYLESKLKQIELQLQQKEYYYQQIQSKALENRQDLSYEICRQLYKKLANDFSSFKLQTSSIVNQKQSVIHNLTSQLLSYQQSQQQLMQHISKLQQSLIKTTEQNNRLKKQIIQKNLFIESYFKKDALRQEKNKDSVLGSSRKRYNYSARNSEKQEINSTSSNPIEEQSRIE